MESSTWRILRDPYIKEALNVFFWKFFSTYSCEARDMKMVRWIGTCSLLLKRLKDSWMVKPPTNNMSETRRQISIMLMWPEKMRKDEAENPDLPDTREEWNATQVASHEKLFPFIENLRTSMFIASSEFSEAQRERLASSLSLQRNDVAAIVLLAEKLTGESFSQFNGEALSPNKQIHRSSLEMLQFVQNIHSWTWFRRETWSMGNRWINWRVRLRWRWNFMLLDMGRHSIYVEDETIQEPSEPFFLQLESKTVVRFSTMPSLSAFESAWTGQHNESNFGSPQEHQETVSKKIQIKTLSRTLKRGIHVPISTGAPGETGSSRKHTKRLAIILELDWILSLVQSFFQCGTLTGSSDSRLTDGKCGQNTAQDVFAQTHIFLVCIGFKVEEVPRFRRWVCAFQKADLDPCSMIHFHPFLSSQSILQLARILSLILLAKFSCAVHVKGTGLAAEEPSATGHEPNDFTKENDSAVAPTWIFKDSLLVLCCRQFLRGWCNYSCSVRDQRCADHGNAGITLFSQQEEASADEPEIYHSGREKFGTTLIIVPIKHLVIQ